jgi:hypothetical protein
MNWTYLIALLAVLVVGGTVVPVVTVAPGRRRRDGRTDLQADDVFDAERLSTCIACRCPVTDEETHWKVIHRVPA